MNHQPVYKGDLIPFTYSYEKAGCLIEIIESTRQELIEAATEKVSYRRKRCKIKPKVGHIPFGISKKELRLEE